MPFSARQGFFGGNLWTPADTSTVIWLNSDDDSQFEVTNSGGIDYVSTWINRSGGTNFTNPTLEDGPVFTSGMSSVPFTNTKWLQAASTFFSVANPDFLCVMRVRWNEAAPVSAYYKPFAVGDGNGKIELGIYPADWPGNWRWNHGDGSSDHGTVNPGSSNPEIRITSWERASGTTYSDDTMYVVGNVSARTANVGLTNSPSLSGNTYVGGSTDVLSFNGSIFEIVVCEQNSTDTRQKLEGYMAWKYGDTDELPAGHPYKEDPPMT